MVGLGFVGGLDVEEFGGEIDGGDFGGFVGFFLVIGIDVVELWVGFV